MYPLVCALAAGLFAISLAPALPDRLLSLPLAALVLALACVPAMRWLAALALGALLGLQHGWQLQSRQLDVACELRPVTLTGYISNLPRVTPLPEGRYRQRFEFRTGGIPGCPGPRRLLLSYYGESLLRPDQHWRFEVRLKRPWGLANPGSFNMQAWFAQTGIDAVGSVRGEGQRLSLAVDKASHQGLRWHIGQSIRKLDLKPQAEALLLAITVADRSGIDHHLWRRLQLFGLNHLFVISGLHIGMVAGFAFIIGKLWLRLLGLWFGNTGPVMAAPALMAMASALFYTALAGFSLSTVRALVMLCCLLGAQLFGRRMSPWRSLLLAAVALLLINPLSFLGSGPWLSFGAVAWLLWLSCWRRSGGNVVTVVKTHLSMSLLMVPLGSWWFGGFSLVAAPANLLLVPAVSLYLVPVALLGLLCWLPGMDWSDALAATLWRLAALPLEPALNLLGELELSLTGRLFLHWHADLPVLVLALAGLAFALLPARPWRYAVTACLAMPLALQGSVAQRTGYPFELTALDVGQGTAVVIRAGSRSLLYDTGGGDPAGLNMADSVVLPYLRSRGIRRLDAMILSHSDADHSAGAGSVLRAMPVASLWLNRPASEGQLCRAGISWRWPGGVEFRFLSPSDVSRDSENDSSCVLQITVAGRRILLPGDISASRERELVAYWRVEGLASDLLLAAHHGSDTSSTWSWLRTVAASEVVYTRGYGNAFGHPHPRVTARVAETGAAVGDTALEGAISYRLMTDGRWQRRAHREQVRFYWMY